MMLAGMLMTAQTDFPMWVEKLGYPIAMGFAMAWALWKVLSVLTTRHIKFVDAIEGVVKSQSDSLMTITTSLVSITTEHKSLVGELRVLAGSMNSLTEHMSNIQEQGIHPKTAVIFPPGESTNADSPRR